MIEGIQGRIEEALTLKGKDKNVTIHPAGFHRIKDGVQLSAWQIVQQSPDSIKVVIVNPSRDFNAKGFADHEKAEL
jgi:hypothetical protein